MRESELTASLRGVQWFEWVTIGIVVFPLALALIVARFMAMNTRSDHPQEVYDKYRDS